MDTVRTRRVIDVAGADAVLAAAEAKAREQGSRVVVAVVDPSGELVALRRTPGAQVASSRVAVNKARTAAIYRRPSRDFEEQASHGRPSALHLAYERVTDVMHVVQGTATVVTGGEMVGARARRRRASCAPPRCRAASATSSPTRTASCTASRSCRA